MFQLQQTMMAAILSQVNAPAMTRSMFQLQQTMMAAILLQKHD
jgi:hypothetical protein